MWTKIGLGQFWDGPAWKNVIPNTSNIVTLAPREGEIFITFVLCILGALALINVLKHLFAALCCFLSR